MLCPKGLKTRVIPHAAEVQAVTAKPHLSNQLARNGKYHRFKICKTESLSQTCQADTRFPEDLPFFLQPGKPNELNMRKSWVMKAWTWLAEDSLRCSLML